MQFIAVHNIIFPNEVLFTLFPLFSLRLAPNLTTGFGIAVSLPAWLPHQWHACVVTVQSGCTKSRFVLRLNRSPMCWNGSCCGCKNPRESNSIIAFAHFWRRWRSLIHHPLSRIHSTPMQWR